jgi:carbonic anhydrase/acetyltransferase-like protein (isoleucine patch superfamily)
MKYLNGKTVKGKNVYVNRLAFIAGSVELSDGVNIWAGASLRGDECFIKIGENSNVQDNATIHTSENFPAVIGKGVTVGHNAVVHGCTVCDNVMIGMHATVLDGAVIGSGSIIGAGAVITGGKTIPENSIVVGNPFKIIRQSSEKDLEYIRKNAEDYALLAAEYEKLGF